MEQIDLAVAYKRMPKLKLVGQALNNWILAEKLNEVNQKQSEKITRITDEMRKWRDMAERLSDFLPGGHRVDCECQKCVAYRELKRLRIATIL